MSCQPLRGRAFVGGFDHRCGVLRDSMSRPPQNAVVSSPRFTIMNFWWWLAMKTELPPTNVNRFVCAGCRLTTYLRLSCAAAGRPPMSPFTYEYHGLRIKSCE